MLHVFLCYVLWQQCFEIWHQFLFALRWKHFRRTNLLGWLIQVLLLLHNFCLESFMNLVAMNTNFCFPLSQVYHGNLNFTIGQLQYVGENYLVFFLCGFAGLVIISVIIYISYRKAFANDTTVKRIRDQIALYEIQVAQECKEGIKKTHASHSGWENCLSVMLCPPFSSSLDKLVLKRIIFAGHPYSNFTEHMRHSLFHLGKK